MRILALSDLHGNLPKIKNKVDVVCICGDIVPLDCQRDTMASLFWFNRFFTTWCEKLKCEKVIFIGGNHDFFLMDAGVDDMLNVSFDGSSDNVHSKIVYLRDKEYVYEGVKFYGTPWCPVLFNWAFYGTSENLNNLYGKIPNDVDILLSHSPGKYVNDTGVSLGLRNKPEYGSAELTEVMTKRKAKLWLSGHIHSGNHQLTDWNDITKVANVSLLNEDYEVEYEPLILNYNEKKGYVTETKRRSKK